MYHKQNQMKKIVLFIMCLMVFAGCSRNTNYYEEPVPNPENTDNKNEAQKNAEKVFGTTFDSNQDWCSTTNGQVTIEVNISVTMVHLLVEVSEVKEDCP